MNKVFFNKAIQFIFALLVFVVFIVYVINNIPSANFDLNFLSPYKSMIIKGWLNTIYVSFLSLLLSIILGLAIYFLLNRKIPFFKYVGVIFNDVIFGTPLLVMVIISYYFIGTAFNYDNRFVIGILALSLYMAPYMSNVFKGGMESIDKHQFVVAKLYGFSKWQTYRYIIFPQLLRVIVPPLTGNFTFLIKGSALLEAMGYRELFNAVSTAQANTYAYTEGFIVVWIAYLLITIPLIRLTYYLEKKVTL